MSCDEVVIGKGNRGISAIRIFDILGEHGFSQNSVSFWISECILGTGITIFKNTEEGQMLQSMIDDKKPLAELQEWVDSLIIRNMDATKLLSLMEAATKKAFALGKRAKEKEIRAVLGLNVPF